MRWEKRGMEENVKALILKDQGAQRREEIYTTTISSPVSRTAGALDNQGLLFVRTHTFYTHFEEC